MNPAELNTFEKNLSALIVKFEQYFLGIERIAPIKKREELAMIIRQTQPGLIRNTSLRFKFQTLVNKFHTYDRYWQKNIRKIEDGTYERNVFKASLKVQGQASEEITQKKSAQEYPKSVVQLYHNYLLARQQCGMDVENVTIDSIYRQLSERVARLKETHGDRRISFKIELKDNKPIIKAIVKTKEDGS